MVKISLVICTYNRDKYLPTALESIKKQSAEKQLYEIIVVDNNSTDNTAAIAKKFIAENTGINASYIFENQKGLSFARNRGLKEASGEIISYVDDDAFLAPDYLQCMLDFFDAHPHAAGVGGKVIPKYEDGAAPAWMSKYLNGFVGKVDHGEDILKYNKGMKYPAGCNMTYTKAVLLKAGGFNNELTFRSDDKYIFYRVNALTPEIYYNPSTWVYHIVDNTRLEKSNFKKLFLKTGNEEKKRIISEHSRLGLLKKFAGYIIKFVASFILLFAFTLKGQFAKGQYLVLAQWYTLKGFLASNVYVR
jgi:glycosyltransferase involved in cell wall biosynthesis